MNPSLAHLPNRGRAPPTHPQIWLLPERPDQTDGSARRSKQPSRAKPLPRQSPTQENSPVSAGATPRLGSAPGTARPPLPTTFFAKVTLDLSANAYVATSTPPDLHQHDADDPGCPARLGRVCCRHPPPTTAASQTTPPLGPPCADRRSLRRKGQPDLAPRCVPPSKHQKRPRSKNSNSIMY